MRDHVKDARVGRILLKINLKMRDHVKDARVGRILFKNKLEDEGTRERRTRWQNIV